VEAEGYGYIGGGEEEYIREAWASMEPAIRGGRYGYDGYPYVGGYRYGGGAAVEWATGGGEYGYGGGASVEGVTGGGGMDMVEDMTSKVVEREHKSVVLARHWINDGAERHQWTHRGVYEVGVLRRSHYLCKFRLQLFNIV
jgi:hypothetical protein